ncbi:hypothetical protein [Streptomyces purpureus]|uniref:Uncharacterized protein n=1 Tax=Streptomyces purpureus TaxID=1951 RepID=A0A918HIB8_9ACTN|nr:hypothetical protein [Streptomyces purpureus]GGT62667.1 hypothetical protein GCM10014713_65050 [Streptomyces purpureus]
MLAEERGFSIGRLVAALVAARPTAAQRAEQVVAARAHAREVIGVEISEFACLDVLGSLRRIAAEKLGPCPAGTPRRHRRHQCRDRTGIGAWGTPTRSR